MGKTPSDADERARAQKAAAGESPPPRPDSATAAREAINRDKAGKQSAGGSGPNGDRPEQAAREKKTRTGPDPQQQSPPSDFTDEELRELEKARLEHYHLKDRRFPKPMAEEAFYGIAGQIVSIIEPTSEASREALLAQFLVGIGNIVGRGPTRKQASLHHLNEYTVLVGVTGISRKGAAWAAIYNLLELLDPDWAHSRIRESFQSGEAIIHAVRDPSGKGKTADPGEPDKRLLILEEEYARLLSVAGRPNNTLSATTRKLWDGKEHQYTEAKHSREKATGAHIGLIGHITLIELLDCLAEVENKNGYSNRILWIATRRTKRIALPEWIEWPRYPDILNHLAAVIKNFKIKRPMKWSPKGELAWRKFYDSISVTTGGILGSLIARTDAHVLRLSMLYAVLDNSSLLEPKHLAAATAFWKYCVRSAQWAFGQKTGDKHADKLCWALQHEPQGMTKTEIREQVFGRNHTLTDIDKYLSFLVDADLAFMRLERTQTVKKPIERWFYKEPE